MRKIIAKIGVFAFSVTLFCGVVCAGEPQVGREPADKNTQDRVVSTEPRIQATSDTVTLGSFQTQKTKTFTEGQRKKTVDTMNNSKSYIRSPEGTGDKK